MKSKKLISLLCAAALSVSSFAGLAVTASAASDPVWSFDGSDITGWSGTVAPEVKTDEGSTDQYLNFLAGTTTKANDTSFTLPAAAQLSNDYVLEYDTNIHTSNGMGRLSQYTQLAFTGASPVQDPQVYNGEEYLAAAAEINPDSEHSWNSAEEKGWGYSGDIVSSLTSRVELQGNWLINYDGANAPSMDDGDAQVGDDKWVRVRAAVKDGKAAVTIADSNQKYVDAQEFTVSATQLSKIMLTFGRADTSLFIPTTPANIKLDNIKVYDGIANAPAFSTDGLRATAIVATPVPAPEKVAGAAPLYVAPSNAESVYTADFNSAATGMLAYVQTTEQDPVTVVNGMKVKLGSRDTGEDQKTYASIVKTATGDKALRLSADKFSTNGRGPIVSLDDNIDISDMTSGSAVMSFAVYLSKTDLDGIERLFLFDNTTNVDGNGCARDVLAVITTEDIQNEDESYKYTAGEANIGVQVEPEQWHNITVVVSQDNYRVFVDGQYKDEDGRLAPALKNDLVGTGEGNKNAVSHLPLLAVENTKSDAGTAYSTALIDNVLAYYVQGDLEPKNLPTVGEPEEPEVENHNATIEWDNTAKKATITAAADEEAVFDGVLIHAAYDSLGLVKSVKTYNATNITTDGIEVAFAANDTVYTGDKLLLWNNLKDMVPYGSLTVEAGETPVQKYTVTNATTDTNGTVAINPTTAKADDTITLTVTPNDGYEVDTVKAVPADDSSNTAIVVTKDTTDSTKYTFTMPAENVKVTATFKATAPTSTPEVTEAPTSTPEVTTAPTSTPEVTTAPTSTPEVTTAPTSTPEVTTAPTATPVPTYTVSGTVDAGVKEVKLHSSTAADDHTADIPGTIDGTTVTFANVPAGTYTVEATAKTGYKNVVVKVGETATATVTVTDANVTNIAITTSPISTATIGVLTGATNIGDKTADDLSQTLAFAAPTAENKVAVTGTLKYVDSYPAMGAVAQTHYYLPYKISGLNENAVVYVQSKDGSNYTDPETGKTYKKVTSASFDNDAKTELFGVQAVSAAKNSLTIMVDSDGDGTVYDKTTYTIDISALTLAEPTTAVPYAEGTITYDEESAAASFVDYSRVTSTVADGANGNATKVQNLQSGKGGSGAGYNPFTEAYPATGDAVKVSFDVTIPVRNAWVSVRGTKPGTGNRDNAATNRIFTIGAEGSGIVKVYSGTDVVDSIENTDIIKKWYHVDAVVNNTTKKTTIKIYNYKANNNYTNETALYDKTVDFRDSTVAGVVAMDYSSNVNNANMQMDNLYINDPTYVAPNKVTVTAPAEADGTLAADKTVAKTGDLITVTATAKAGKKLTAVKANDTVLNAGDDGKYTYTMPDPAVDVTISATYARADVTAIEISGDAQVSVSARTANYTAVAKADTTPVDGTITWSIAPAETGGAAIATNTAINSSTGVLTLDPTQGAGKIVITASTKKDITSDSTEAANTVTATKEVTLLSEPVYGLAVATGLTGGSVALKVNGEAATQVKQSETLIIEPTAAAGYAIDKVYYILTSALDGNDPQWTEVTKTGDAYTVAGTALTGDITVKATFTAIPYAITNATVAANGNSAAIKIGDADAGTATVGQTVTIVPTVAQGYKVASVAVTKTGAEDTVTVTNNTFKMPAYAVTVTVTFEAWDGVYYTEDFSTMADVDTLGKWATNTGRAGTATITDRALVMPIASDNKRSKAIVTLADTIDFSSGDSTKISFDLQLNPAGTDSKPTVGELTLGNSDNMVLFAIRRSSKETTINTYAGGKLSTNVSSGNGIGTSTNNWGSNEYVWNISNASGPAMTVLKTDETTELAGVSNAWYHVELTLSDNTMTASVYNKTDATAIATATYDITGLTKNISTITSFLDQGSSSGSGSNVKITNILVTTSWYTAPSAGGTE